MRFTYPWFISKIDRQTTHLQAILSLASFATEILFYSKTQACDSFLEVDGVLVYAYALGAAAVASHVAITTSLLFLLFTSRDCLPTTNHIIQRLIVFNITTGLPSSVRTENNCLFFPRGADLNARRSDSGHKLILDDIEHSRENAKCATTHGHAGKSLLWTRFDRPAKRHNGADARSSASLNQLVNFGGIRVGNSEIKSALEQSMTMVGQPIFASDMFGGDLPFSVGRLKTLSTAFCGKPTKLSPPTPTSTPTKLCEYSLYSSEQDDSLVCPREHVSLSRSPAYHRSPSHPANTLATAIAVFIPDASTEHICGPRATSIRADAYLEAPSTHAARSRIVRSDGATIIHYGTSPRSSLRLTRDTSSNPLWNVGGQAGSAEEEDAVTGRLGRFRRRFEGLGEGDGIDWTSEAAGESMENVQQMVEGKGKGKSS
ncbi:hypothetical protein CERSUDRAFT_126513 [Gelatoporia subvermispora B]|uniref:Uncharacterized protein n=1 Tax=Ceriporiopsis subvermispora (strain B) TaxID=914234 RepID=M2QKL6_CERS8|nr:hypothetical protein CERSUDRAFT_126513 [Gelatoporia subvermispora B]